MPAGACAWPGRAASSGPGRRCRSRLRPRAARQEVGVVDGRFVVGRRARLSGASGSAAFRRLGSRRLRGSLIRGVEDRSAWCIGRSVAGSGRIPLGDRLEQQDRARDRGVQRADRRRASGSGRRGRSGAGPPAQRPWPSLPTTIASGPRRSAWRAVSGALGLGADDPQAPDVEVGQGAGKVVDRSEQQVLDRAGRGLDRGRASAAPGGGSGRRRRGRPRPRRSGAASRRSGDPRANRARARTRAPPRSMPRARISSTLDQRRGPTTSATPWWPSKPASAVSVPPSTSTIGIRRLVAWRTSRSSAWRRCGTTSSRIARPLRRRTPPRRGGGRRRAPRRGRAGRDRAAAAAGTRAGDTDRAGSVGPPGRPGPGRPRRWRAAPGSAAGGDGR